MTNHATYPLLALCVLLTSCAGWQSHREGMSQLDEGKPAEALQNLRQATQQAPDNVNYRADYFRLRDQTIAGLVQKIEQAEQQQDWAQVRAQSQLLLKVDAGNQRAQTYLARLERVQYQREQLDLVDALLAKGALDEAAIKFAALSRLGADAELSARRERLAVLQTIRDQGKQALSDRFSKTVTLELREAGIRQVFEILSKEAKINFILDKDVRADLRTTVFLKDTPIRDIIRFICTTSQLQYKALNDSTLLVYPASDDKQKLYEDLVTRTFYLSAGVAKEVAALIKDMTRLKDVYFDEQLNTVTVRAKADVLAYVEKLVTVQDTARPEVMLDVEVLEVSTSLLDEIGIRYPSSVGVGVQGAAGANGALTWNEVKNANSNLLRVNIANPAVLLNLREESGNTKTLAKPRIRVKNKASARIHIGDKVPVISSSTNGTTISESVSYLDVGIKLDVEPTVRIDNEVEIKIGMEVSNLLDKLTTPAGTQAYRIGTRNTSTVLSLKDGETQVLAGLIRREESNGITGLPGLGRLPLIGPLFGSHKDETASSEIVLLITPHILRNTAPSVSLQNILSGTEAQPGSEPLLLSSQKKPTASGTAGDTPAATTDPADEDTTGPLQWQLPLFVKAGDMTELTLKMNKKQWGARSFSGQLSYDPYRLEVVSVQPSPALQPLLEKDGLISQFNNQQGRLMLAAKLTGPVPEGEWVKVKLLARPAAQGPIMLSSDAFAAQDGEGKPVRLPSPLEQKITVMP